MSRQDPPFDELAGSGLQLGIGPFLVHVRSELAAVREHLSRVYSDFPRTANTGGHFEIAITGSPGLRRWARRQARLYVDGTQPFLPLPERLAGAFFDWGLNWAIGQNAHHWLALHAAVVERNGRALVMPAPPGSGKSTLCAALAFSGWRFFSDEFALVHPDTRVIRPLPRPISLKNRSIEIIHSRHPDVVMTEENVDVEQQVFVHVRPPSDSQQRANEGAHARWIMLPRYQAGSPTIFAPLSKSECLIAVTDQCFNFNFLGDRGFQCLVELVRSADCFSLTYSDLDDALARLALMADR